MHGARVSGVRVAEMPPVRIRGLQLLFLEQSKAIKEAAAPWDLILHPVVHWESSCQEAADTSRVEEMKIFGF